ncbi:hypothetical protein [Nostoc sp.]|uniref:hypothetical protein n=2 Tax=Nostoc sp. TaxID=1180 RepID=UPI002FFBFB38
MKKNSEVRIQESESRRSLRDAARTRTRYRYAISRGFRPATTKVDDKTRKFGGGAKTPIIHPPVVQNSF